MLSSLTDSGDEGDTAIFNNLVYTRSGGSWSSTGASAKGDKGDDGSDGLRGKITLEGSGPPGTSTNLATATTALNNALTDAGLTSGDLQAGDLYLDTTNHAFYKKTNSGWTTRGASFRPQAFKGVLSTLSDSGNENDTAIYNNKIYKRVGSSWVDQSISVKGADGAPGADGSPGTNGNTLLQGSSSPSGAAGALNDTFLDTTNHIIYKKTGSSTWTAQGSPFKGATGSTGPTGPGVKVYSVALGSDASTSDVALTTSFSDMYLADVMTNEGSILTATSVKGSSTEFTISSTGRYKIEVQASVRAVNYSTTTTYSPTVTIQILNTSTSPDTTLYTATTTLEADAGSYSIAISGTSPGRASDVINISRIFRFTLGTKIKIQAKTSTSTSSSPTKLTYLQLATDAEAIGAADTVVTFTKL